MGRKRRGSKKPKQRLGKLETREQRKERCVKQVKRQQRVDPKSRRVNPHAICEANVPKFKGRQRRVLR